MKKDYTRAIIVANGNMTLWPNLLKVSKPQDLIIAADGGTKNCLKWNLTPDIIVGDLDSINTTTLSKMKQQGVKIIPYPPKKDFTDLELALRLAIKKNIKDIIILGALGLRWDMSISSILFLAAGFLQDAQAILMDGFDEIICLKDGSHIQLQGRPGDLLSLIPLTPKVTGITLKGLDYLLNDENLVLGQTQGISNCFEKHTAFIQIEAGLLLVIISRIV